MLELNIWVPECFCWIANDVYRRQAFEYCDTTCSCCNLNNDVYKCILQFPTNFAVTIKRTMWRHRCHWYSKGESIWLCIATKREINLTALNPFLANVPILYPLKTPENQRFFGVFRRYKMGTPAGNKLINVIIFKLEIYHAGAWLKSFSML